jgi:membrane-anchored protein YejM (alkaline phosphatase superfamily)
VRHRETQGLLERDFMSSKMLRRFRRRQLSRRIITCFVALCLIALTAAGLVWLMDSFRIYSPVYYEPKDVERERYETQRRALDGKPIPRGP